MQASGSVSQMIAQVKAGDEAAFSRLHQRYWQALVNLARRKLKGAAVRDIDEEDVAQSAFVGFYQTLKAQRLPRLTNRHELLALLSHIIACKAVNQIQHSLTKKQGAGQVQNVSALDILSEDGAYTPLQEAILNDCYEFYLGALPEQLRDFAVLHLAGLSNRGIAERMGCVERTVERKIALLRSRWQEIAAESVNQDLSTFFG